MPGRTNVLIIRTPEGIVFSQLLASPVTRFLAWFLDFMVVATIMSVLSMFMVLMQIIGGNVAIAVSTIAYFVVSIGYGILTEWRWRGQTIGKRIFRLRVVDLQGLRLQFSQIVIRNLLRFIDSLPALYFVGGVACLINRRTQRLGDLAANTVVIRYPKITQPDVEQLLAGKYNSLRQYPHLEARLRQRVTPAEAGIALQGILRRDEFDPEARIELYQRIAEHFRARAEFPPEATDGITDEQYVRNIADVLYRTPTTKREKLAA